MQHRNFIFCSFSKLVILALYTLIWQANYGTESNVEFTGINPLLVFSVGLNGESRFCQLRASRLNLLLTDRSTFHSRI